VENKGTHKPRDAPQGEALNMKILRIIWLKISATVRTMMQAETVWDKRKHADSCIKLLKLNQTKKTLRVVHVTPYFNPPESAGGIAVHVHELITALSKEGHETAVYTAFKTPQLIDRFLEVHRFPAFEPYEMPRLFPRIPNPIPTPNFFTELCKEHDILHIHAHEYVTSFLAILAAKKAGIPTVLTIHSVEKGLEKFFLIRNLRRILRYTFFALTVNSADIVIVPSNQVLRVTKGYNPKKVVKIVHGISLEPFQNLEQSSEYVLYLGRLYPVKCPELLIRAIPLVLNKVDAKFVIAGVGIQRAYLETLVKQLGVQKYVKFLGLISHDEVPKVIAKASVFVAPGLAGYSLLEAAASEKPIVSPNLSWNVEAIGEQSAFFVKPNDVEDLAKAIVKILSDRKLASELAFRARRYVEEHRSWRSIVKQYIKVYDQVRRM
jgi:1,4-alpha-glucan branching enzyme